MLLERNATQPNSRDNVLMVLMALLPFCAVLLARQKENPAGKLTESAHPARFSPDDKFSAARVANKTRFGVLPTQQAPIVL